MSLKNNPSGIIVNLTEADQKKLKALADQAGKSVEAFIAESIKERMDKGSSQHPDTQFQKALEKILKKYAPVFEKLAKS